MRICFGYVTEMYWGLRRRTGTMQDPVHISASLFDPEFSFSQSRCDCANKRDRSVPTCRKSGLNTGCPTVCAVGPFAESSASQRGTKCRVKERPIIYFFLCSLLINIEPILACLCISLVLWYIFCGTKMYRKCKDNAIEINRCWSFPRVLNSSHGKVNSSGPSDRFLHTRRMPR